MFLTVYDSFMPYYIMITAMFPISSTAVFIIKERNARTLSLIDSTHVSRTVNLLSIELSQLFMASVQNGIVIGFLFLSGTYIHPSANLATLYLNLLLLSFLSINIGAFLSILTKSTSAANLSAFLIMISFQLLGGTFFFVGKNISQWIPLYYANLISRSILINGKNFLFILPYLWYLTLFSIVFFIIAIISFQKQKNEEVL
jgi:ABC-type multidrug transport system permease subunit